MMIINSPSFGKGGGVVWDALNVETRRATFLQAARVGIVAVWKSPCM